MGKCAAPAALLRARGFVRKAASLSWGSQRSAVFFKTSDGSGYSG